MNSPAEGKPNVRHNRSCQEDKRGDIPAVFAVFDASITWHVPGHSPLSGDFRGHDQVAGFFQRTMELSRGAFSIDVHNLLAKGDLVIVLVTVNAQRDGVSAAFPEVHVWRVKDGRAIEFCEYQGDEERGELVLVVTYRGRSHWPFVAHAVEFGDAATTQWPWGEHTRKYLLLLSVPVLIQAMGRTPCLERALPCSVPAGRGARPNHCSTGFQAA